MVNFFDEYKPIRNIIRKFNVWDVIHELYKIKKGKYIPDIIEFIYLNSIVYSSDYRNIKPKHPEREWNKFLSNTNKLHEKINALWIDNNVFGFLHKQYLNQLKASPNHLFNHLYRYYYIFSDNKLVSHVENKIGMSYRDFFTCGMWIHSVYAKTYIKEKAYFLQEKYNGSSLSIENINETLKILSIDFLSLKELLRGQLKYDMCAFITHDYEHIRKPIFESDGYLYCLFSDLLLYQYTSGVYYLAEIYDKKHNLNNAFGACFEQYVGFILEKNKTYGLQITKELIYNRGQNKTSDWTIESKNTIVFIECKTKHLKIDSKKYEDVQETDLNSMVNAVTQVYKVFSHYKNNKINELKFCANNYFIPLIITLEEWYAGIPIVNDEIKKRVKSNLKLADIDETIVDRYKFHITSISSFEFDVQMMTKIGFKEFYDGIKDGTVDKDKFEFVPYFGEEIEKEILEPLKVQCGE